MQKSEDNCCQFFFFFCFFFFYDIIPDHDMYTLYIQNRLNEKEHFCNKLFYSIYIFSNTKKKIFGRKKEKKERKRERKKERV